MGKLIHVLSALISLEDLLDMGIRRYSGSCSCQIFRSIDKSKCPIGPILLENDDVVGMLDWKILAGRLITVSMAPPSSKVREWFLQHCHGEVTREGRTMAITPLSCF